MKHRSRNFSATGIVLKRSKVGETDRILTLITREYGKFVSLSKGVRKITSTKRASLEPGNLVKAYFVKTKSLPLLTQARLINDCSLIRNDLKEIRKLAQFLEIMEKLFVEEEIESNLFQEILNLRQKITTQNTTHKQIKNSLENLIKKLGYRNPRETEYDSVLDYVAALTNRSMRSFEYLTTPK